MIAKIAVSGVPYWIDKPYDYSVPEKYVQVIEPGMRVFVPFTRGNRVTEGIVLAISKASALDNVKDILSVADAAPILTEKQIRLALFMRERYFCTVYDAVKSILPAGLWFDKYGKQRTSDRFQEFVSLAVDEAEAEAFIQQAKRKAPRQAAVAELLQQFESLLVLDVLQFTSSQRSTLQKLQEKGIVQISKKEIYRRPVEGSKTMLPLPILNEEQQSVFDQFLADPAQQQVSLLYGVTGSGKTSIYIHLIQHYLSIGRSAILLVPEIALTPQMIATFSSYFGDEVALLHSGLSAGERYDEWKRLKQKKAHLAIGTRSAVFAPVEDIGLIIIDEEQEETYKSESSPRYSAKEVARYRCYQDNGHLLLGSATPDICSFYRAKKGTYGFLRLNNRYNRQPLPSVSVVDMKQEIKKGNGSTLSTYLTDEIRQTIDDGEQTILFLNRRGTNKFVTCMECGYIYQCPRCSVSLTYHGFSNRLMCHYCGYTRVPDQVCPDCAGELRYVGAGTQMVESELQNIFPSSDVLRVDADTVGPAGSHRVLFERFLREKIPVMVGTQMVTKGLNFENVTLVGVLSADQSLYTGDYRSAEKTFSLLTQVIGRGGRGEKPGRAVIQTYTPANETIRLAASQDYDSFYEAEIQIRRLQNAPPFADRLCVSASGKTESLVLSCLKYCKTQLQSLCSDQDGFSVLGPAPMPIVKMNDYYRYRVHISCHVNARIRQAVSSVLTDCNTQKRFFGVTVFAENDPAL